MLSLLKKAALDRYVLMLLGMVVLGSILPPRGAAVSAVDFATDAGVTCLFFLQGAKLSRAAFLGAAMAWRLHLTVLGVTFVLFPLLGIGIGYLPFLSATAATGILFLTLLPSTVQSSIALTSMARGDVAAAICSASLSNLLGIFLTPVLASLLIGGSGGGPSLEALENIVRQLFLPFAAGHLLRPLIYTRLQRYPMLLTIVDRGSILLIVYSAFGAAVKEGLWSRVTPMEVLAIAATCLVLLGVVLLITWVLGERLGFSREDAIVLQFCGTKKSLASGVPIASLLFAPAVLGQMILPLMLFHQFQLIACTIIARHRATEERNSMTAYA